MLPATYKQLSERHYKDYTTCQLPGCNKELEKFQRQKVRKYCCIEHAKEAQKLYIAEWKITHKENVRLWNKRYATKRLKIKRGLLNENQETKTYQL